MSQWVLRAVAFLFGLSVALPALAASTINTTQPVQNVPYNAAPIRDNFGHAASDINALQSMNIGTSPPSAPSYGTLWLRQPTSGTTYTLNIWIASANTWAPIASIDGATGYWEPPVGGGTLPSLISAATTDLGSVPNAALYVTGAQSIASFGASAPPGQLKFIVFTGAATLIYNNTYMILPGSVNFTAGANSSVIMLSLGQGKWRMLSSGSGGGGTCDLFTATTSGCVPASGGGTVNFLRADGTWVPPGGDTRFTIASGFTNTVGTLNIGTQTIANNDTLSEQFWVTRKGVSYVVNSDNGGTSDTGVFLVVDAPGVTYLAPNPSLATKGNSYQFGTDGTNGFVVTTVGGAATIYGCAGPNTGATSFSFDALDVQIVDDGVNYKCVTAAPVTQEACFGVSGTPNTVMKFTASATCGNSHITDDGVDIIATAGTPGGTATGGSINLIAGAGTDTGDGGAIAITSGASGNNGTTTGGITLTAANAAASSGTIGGAVAIVSGSGDGGSAGGGITATAGAADGIGAIAGAISLTAGNVTTASVGAAGGAIILTTGSATSGTAGSGGAMQLLTGAGVGTGVSGAITLRTGDANASTGTSGDILITTGTAQSSGNITLNAGEGAASLAGGVFLQAGNHASGGGAGGIVSGSGGNSSDGAGGAVTFYGGNGGDVTSGGFQFTAGATTGANTSGGGFGATAAGGSGLGDGGGIAFGAGAGDTTSNGGSINLTAAITFGTQSGVPGDGNYRDGTLAISGHITTISGGDWHGSISSCGGGTPAFQSSNDNDTSGRVTVGSGVVTTCTITFGRKYNAAAIGGPAYAVPNCVATNIGTTPNAISYTSTIDAVVFTFAADINTTGGKFSYWCTG